MMFCATCILILALSFRLAHSEGPPVPLGEGTVFVEIDEDNAWTVNYATKSDRTLYHTSVEFAKRVVDTKRVGTAGERTTTPLEFTDEKCIFSGLPCDIKFNQVWIRAPKDAVNVSLFYQQRKEIRSSRHGNNRRWACCDKPKLSKDGKTCKNCSRDCKPSMTTMAENDNLMVADRYETICILPEWNATKLLRIHYGACCDKPKGKDGKACKNCRREYKTVEKTLDLFYVGAIEKYIHTAGNYDETWNNFRNQSENNVCADCGATSTRYCAMQFGCFVCEECGGLHRESQAYPVKLMDQILEINGLDTMNPKRMEKVMAGGNTQVKWRFPGGAISSDSTPAQKRAHIITKYYEILADGNRKAKKPRDIDSMDADDGKYVPDETAVQKAREGKSAPKPMTRRPSMPNNEEKSAPKPKLSMPTMGRRSTFTRPLTTEERKELNAVKAAKRERFTKAKGFWQNMERLNRASISPPRRRSQVKMRRRPSRTLPRRRSRRIQL